MNGDDNNKGSWYYFKMGMIIAVIGVVAVVLMSSYLL